MNKLQVSNGLIRVQMSSASRCNSLITWASTRPMTWAGALLAAILLAGSGPSASAQQKVGYVLQMEGTWMLDGASQPLGMGQALPGGALLLNAAPRDEDNVVVADLKGEVIKTVRCKSGACKECHESAGCHDPIRPLPNAEDKPTTFGTMLDAVLELFAGKPDRYSIHRVRGSESVGRRAESNPSASRSNSPQ